MACLPEEFNLMAVKSLSGAVVVSRALLQSSRGVTVVKQKHAEFAL